MGFLRVVVLLLAAALACGGSAFARDLTADEKGSLAQAVAAFDTAMRNKDIPTVVATVPPEVFEAIAADAGISNDALIAEVIKQTTQVMSQVTFDTFAMDVAHAAYKETPDGMPYALIPTETVIDMGAKLGKVKSSSQTFGLLDAGKWYLIRTDDAGTLAVVKKVFPSYAAEDFPAATTEPVTQ